MSRDELVRHIDVLRSEGLKLRIQKKTGQLVNTASITKNRREVAKSLCELSKKN